MTSTRTRALVALGLAALMASCPFTEEEKAVAPLDEGAGPCFRVNLLDGLSEDDPAEVEALYDCLNARGGFDGAGGFVEALVVSPGREGRVGALELARLVNRLPDHIDLPAVLEQASGLLREQDEFLVHLVRTTAEWSYGRPWPAIEAAYADGSGGELRAPEAIEGGLMAPLVPVLRTLSQAVLDGGDLPRIAVALETLTAMPELAGVLTTLTGMLAGQDSNLLENTTADLGAFIQAAVDGDDALLSLVQAMLTPAAGLDGRAVATAILGPIDGIVADSVTVDRAVTTVGDLYERRLLQQLPAQMLSLLQMDPAGGSLSEGETSAFEALFLLLDVADQPVDCGLLFQRDSLAIEILEQIAAFDADTVEGLVGAADGLVTDLLGLGGLICTGLDPALTDYWPAIQRLAESGALQATTPLLRSLRDASDPAHDRLREVVDLLATLPRGGALDEIATLGRRELGEPFVGNVLRVMGAFVTPDSGAPSGDLDGILRVIGHMVTPPAGQGPERSPLGLLIGPFGAVVSTERASLELWLQRWAGLLVDPTSESHALLDNIGPLLDVDPDLSFLTSIGSVLGDYEAAAALYRMLEIPEVAAALAAPTSGTEGEEGLLGMFGRFAADGSLEALIVLLGWAAETFESLSE
jgi:hypothetical protein